MSEEPKRRGPVILEQDLPAADVTPQTAAPILDAPRPAMVRATALAARQQPRGSWLARLFWSAMVALLGIAITTSAWSFVEGLILRNPLLGQITLGLMAILVLTIVAFVLREWLALMRLGRVDTLRQSATAARTGSLQEAQAVAKRVAQLYAGRAELRAKEDRIARRIDDMLDPDAVLAEAERGWLTQLDAQAVEEVGSAARTVAGVTALVPLALMDVLTAMSANIRMIRRIAEIYNGRTGFFGSWRLFRAVATHLVATGAVAVGDDVIGAVAGGGALAKLSRRFGEGVVNGALTARVGVAAIEVCRPMPFAALDRPSVRGIASRALGGLFGSREKS
ncbi:YcjF family protein [Pontivivens insulae]|uniref:TIGR01620 family protein n=1 Tax=Pontivivens insulae TaxID=1639689 RepID=A0A2R8AEB8_9RHOB|nr:TIGR01620 family protein [Pontivivens insulae]RED11817.1 putative membrane protein [Pontivivens insulae]SPF30574.1 hypothetical protein POI8812_02913 [Pontivivens insulae]